MRAFRSPLVAIATTLLSLHTIAHAAELRAGVAKVSITPTPDQFPYGSGGNGPALVGVHDDVFVRALILDDGQRRAAIVVAEVEKVPLVAELTKAIAGELAMPEASIMLAATHTHSVPTVWLNEARPTAVQLIELDHIRKGTLQAVRQANAHLQPARIAFGRGKGWININNGEQAGSPEGYDPLGPSDKTLDVIRLTTAAGLPIAMLVNYATHAETMYRSVTKDGGYEVTGDIPGAVSRILEARPDAAPVVLFTSGAEADQLGIFKSLKYAGRLPAADFGAAGWGLMEAMAQRLSGSVLEVVDRMAPGAAQAKISFATAAATCPGERRSTDRVTQKVTATAAAPVTIPLSLIRINDIVLAGVGGDAASDIGQHFKKASPVTNSTMITMVGESAGYIFTDASYAHPGHGVNGSRLKAGCAENAIVNGLVTLISSNK
jgi:hypothetical protein